MIPHGRHEDRSLKSYRNQWASLRTKRELRMIAAQKKRCAHVVFTEDGQEESIRTRDRRQTSSETKPAQSKAGDAGASSSTAVAKEVPRTMDAMKRCLKEMNVREEIVVISTVEECKATCKKLKRHKYLAVDCEGVALSRTGELCVLHVGAPNLIVMFDICTGGKALFAEGGLKALLQNKSILKIMHDCRSDADALLHQCGTEINNIFDTQLAFAMMRKQAGKDVPFPVGLNTLIKMHSKKRGENIFKEDMKEQMTGTDSYWAIRPMTVTMIGYCAIDISMMKTIYKSMVKNINEDNLKMVQDLSMKYADQFRALEMAYDRNIDGGKPTYGFPEWDAQLEKRRAEKDRLSAAAAAKAAAKAAALPTRTGALLQKAAENNAAQ